MKNTLLILLACIGINARGQSGITWNAPVNVAASMYSNLHPRIGLDGSGNPQIIWGNSTTKKVYYSRWNGSSFTTPAILNPASIPVFTAAWAGPDIAARGDTVYVVYKHTPEDTNHIYVVHSFDAGANFSAPVRVDYLADSVSRFPTISMDATGNPVVAFMKFDSNFMNSRWAVARSTDYGNTFMTDVLASGFSGGAVCDCCPGALINSGNDAFMLYRDNLNNVREMWAGISNDGGNTFTSGMNVDQNGWMISSCPSSGPDGVVIGDTLYTVFMSAASGSSRAYLSKSTTGSMQGGSGNQLTANFAGLSSQNFPRIDNYGTAMGIVWKQLVNSNAQIVMYFTNDILTGIPVAYDTIASNPSNSLTNADIAISNDAVFVVWQDDNLGTIRYRKGTYNSGTGNVDKPVSVNPALSLFPNPVTGNFLTVQLAYAASPNVEYRLYDVLGQEVLHETAIIEHDLFRIDFSEVPEGNYFLKMICGDEIMVEKVARQ